MTYILDLQRLWEISPNSQGQDPAHHELRKKNVVSVIVVAIANEKRLFAALQAVLAQQYIREVIIVNGEDSTTLEANLVAYAERYPKCHIVKTDKNAGLAAAYNLGASHASGQFLLFINGNSILPKDAVFTLLATGIRKPTPWVIGRSEKQTGTKLWGRFKQLFNAMEVLHYQHRATTLPEVSLPGGGLHTSSLRPECLFLSTQSFLELKGLDRKCFHSTFHVDLCLRVHFAGGGVYGTKEMEIMTAPEQNTPLKDNLRMEWQAFRGRLHFYQKYVSKKTNNFLMILLYAGLVLRFFGRCCRKLFVV